MYIWCKAIRVKSIAAIVVFILLGAAPLFGQTDTASKKTSQKDTVATLEERTNTLLENLREYARSKNNLVAIGLRNVLVMNPGKQTQTQTSAQPGGNRFADFEGYTIAGVSVEVLDVFGPELHDLEKKPKNWLERSGNKLHYNTRNWKVRNFLLFEAGDRLDPFKVSESERLIRAEPYIFDSRIFIDSVDEAAKQVYLKVYSKDVWSITGGVAGSFSGPTAKVNLTETNFLGLGHRFSNSIMADPNLPRDFKYSGNYFVSNIGNSYINGRLFYEFFEPQYLNRRYGLNLNRGFYSPTAKWAGGLNLQKTDADAYYSLNDTLVHFDEYKRVHGDFWAAFAGKSPFTEKSSQDESRMVYGFRASRLKYLQRPVITGSPEYLFNNSLLLLGSMGYSKRSYIRSNYIFGFGRTEDIPIGGVAAVVGGYELGERYKRPYAGFYTGIGKFNDETGYWRFSLNAGSFFLNNKFDLGVASAELFYFTNLIPLGRIKWRQYLMQRFTYGINREDWEQVGLNRELGLRGIRNPVLLGKQKFVINYESNFFLPGNFLGFKVAAVMFADVGWLADEKKPIFSGRVYQGYGLGLRIRNEHLVFSTVQVLFAYYPGLLPRPGQNFRLLTSEQAYYRFRDFEFSQPSLVPYN